MATPRLKHNPSHMPEDELIRSFVVRQRDLAAILETVRENTGPSNQHLLILGPRGMGKTTLVNRAVAEVRRDPELSRSWYPILFDEESYTVTTVGELWFQALSHLADQTQSSALERDRRALQTLTDQRRLRDAALARLLEFADAQGKRLLLVFENIDMIFDQQLTDDDAWDVRHTLQNEPRIMVLATSPTRLDSFHDSNKPLYELFREHTLDRLDLEECRLVWRLVTDSELPPNQARPIQIFTGGNTRLLTILGTFARDRSFRELMDDLVGLIDENTPYFKHNVEALPTESRKIFVTLADLWSPATSRQVAERTRGDIRAVSAQLGRLERQGVVEVVRRVDKTQMFQVSERMYNLYYLLRRRGSARVRAVVEFIVRYYDQDGMQRFLDALATEACDLERERRDDHVWAYCELMRRLPDQRLRHDVLRRAPAQFQAIPEVALILQESTKIEDAEPVLSEAELRARLSEAPKDATLLVKLGCVLQTSGDSGAARDAFERALGADDSSVDALFGLWIVLACDSSLTAEDRIARLRSAGGQTRGAAQEAAYPLLAGLLADSGAHDEARVMANEALERWSSNPQTASMVAVAFRALGDRQAAQNALYHAIDIDPANLGAVILLSQMLIEDDRTDEAEAQLRNCLALRPRESQLWLLLVDLFLANRNDRETGLREMKRAVELNPDDVQLALRLGALLLEGRQLAEAEQILGHVVIELGADAGLANLMFVLGLQRKFAEAREILGARLTDSASADVHLAAAVLNSVEGNGEQCLAHLRRAQELAPQRGDITQFIIVICAKAGDLAGARDALAFFLSRHGSTANVIIAVVQLILKHELAPLYVDVVGLLRERIKDRPSDPLMHLLLARVLAVTDAWDDAWASLEVVLADQRLSRRHLGEIIGLLSLAAACGHAARAARTLAVSASAPLFEPLVVALHRVAGEETNPPQEVREVADDIVRDIERLRRGRDERARPSPVPGAPSPAHRRHRQARRSARPAGAGR